MKIETVLSKREEQVAELSSYGFAKKEISEMLGIAEMTVANTARSIYDKLEINSATQLSAWFFLKNKHAVSFDRHDELRKVFEVKRTEKRTHARKRSDNNLNCFA